MRKIYLASSWKNKTTLLWLENLLKIEGHKVFNFEIDKTALDWCDICIMCLPCGKSAHLEAGYAKGKGKKLIIYSFEKFKKGDIDVMYGFADLTTDKACDILKYLKNEENKDV